MTTTHKVLDAIKAGPPADEAFARALVEMTIRTCVPIALRNVAVAHPSAKPRLEAAAVRCEQEGTAEAAAAAGKAIPHTHTDPGADASLSIEAAVDAAGRDGKHPAAIYAIAAAVRASYTSPDPDTVMAEYAERVSKLS